MDRSYLDMEKKNSEYSSERVAHYEALLDRLQAFLAGADRSLPALEAAGAYVKELEQYYGSPEWKLDFAADEAGLLPEDLKRGVLSEDGICNALEEFCERAVEEIAPHEADGAVTPFRAANAEAKSGS